MPHPPTNAGFVLVELMSRSEGGDQWIHLLPAGPSIQTRDRRGPYRLNDPAAVIAASREYAGRRKMPIDYDHALDLAAPNGHAAPAAGWIDALQSRADGIWGRVEWTPRASEKLAHREYRYLSPVLEITRDNVVTGILRASLTNTPNLERLTALASMETQMDKLPELRALLGLPAEATIDDILAKIRELTTAAAPQSAAPDPAKFVPIGDFERVVARVHELDQGISLQAATDHVTRQIETGRLLPFLKDWGVALCSSNKAAFDGFVNKTQGSLQRLLTPLDTKSLNTAADRRSGRGDLSPDELAIAANLGVSKDDYLKTKAARGAAE